MKPGTKPIACPSRSTRAVQPASVPTLPLLTPIEIVGSIWAAYSANRLAKLTYVAGSCGA